MAVCQDLGRVDVGRRDHRLADADRVGQRARRDLRRVEIWSGVDVGRLEIIDKRLVIDQLVDEPDVLRDTLLVG